MKYDNEILKNFLKVRNTLILEVSIYTIIVLTLTAILIKTDFSKFIKTYALIICILLYKTTVLIDMNGTIREIEEYIKGEK